VERLSVSDKSGRGGEPFFEHPAYFCPFRTAADCVDDFEVGEGALSPESDPVGHMNFAGKRGGGEFRRAKTKEALAENNPAELLNDKLTGALFIDDGRRTVPGLEDNRFGGLVELIKVEISLHDIHGKKLRLGARGFNDLHAE